jgi:hypothetical protein
VVDRDNVVGGARACRAVGFAKAGSRMICRSSEAFCNTQPFVLLGLKSRRA